MRHTKHYLSIIALFACAGSIYAQDYFDDVYYNPKKDTQKTVATVNVNNNTRSTTKTTSRSSSYISNRAEMDIDAYNRRGTYYSSQIDTIGSRVENGEDFVYTQQIQKYYNPTIVVDNANILGDVLTNAYGNVEIVIDNGVPVFAPYYSWNWPYYSAAWSPWYWSFNFGGWGWNIGWYDPWYSWNWGWGWGPGWWNPGPSWGPGWGPGWGPAPRPYASWSPGGNRPVGPRPGWSQPAPGRPAPGRNPAPVGNFGGNPGHGNHQLGYHGNSRPSSQPPHTGVVNNNGKWQYNTSATSGHRTAGTGVLPGRQQNVGSGVPGSSNSNVGGQNNRPNNGNKTNITGNHRNTPNNSSTVRSSGNSNHRSSGASVNRSTGGSRSTGGGSRGGGGGRRR